MSTAEIITQLVNLRKGYQRSIDDIDNLLAKLDAGQPAPVRRVKQKASRKDKYKQKIKR